MTTQEIVSKLWNLCNVLRDDGITYHQYVNIINIYFVFENGEGNWNRRTDSREISLG